MACFTSFWCVNVWSEIVCKGGGLLGELVCMVCGGLAGWCVQV